jgi:hypothetical protein
MSLNTSLLTMTSCSGAKSSKQAHSSKTLGSGFFVPSSAVNIPVSVSGRHAANVPLLSLWTRLIVSHNPDAAA